MASVKLKNLPPDARANLPKPGKVSKLNMFFLGTYAFTDAYSRIQNGEGVVSSVAKAGASAIIDDTLRGFFLGSKGNMALFLGEMALMGGQLAIADGQQNTGLMAEAFGGNGTHAKHNRVVNTEAAHTMRQRGMAMINQNGEATRSVLGSEARAYFRNMNY